MYSLDLLRVYRDSIYSSFLLYVVGFAFEIFFNYREKVKTLVPYMIGFGVFSTWMAITREETIWISPFVLGSSVITILFIIFDKECLNKKKKILLYLIPLFIYLVSIFCVCLFNRIAYGEFIRTEGSSAPYKNFVKAVSSVDVENPIISVPLQKEAREKIYKVSPSFSELKDVFEGEKGKIFESYGRIEGEVEEGFFSWEVICALGDHDYSTNIKTFNDALRKITDEINKAFEDGRLKKEDDKASIFDKENFSKLTENIRKAIDFELKLVNVNLKLEEDKYYLSLDDTLERRDIFVEMTGNTSTNSKTYNYKTDKIKINTLTFIKNIYEKLNKPLFIFSLIIYVLLLLRFFFIKKRFKNYKEIIILTSLIMLYFIRIVVIAYVETKMCFATNVMYLSSIYSLQFLFVILSIIFGIKEIVSLKEFLNESKRECRNN